MSDHPYLDLVRRIGEWILTALVALIIVAGFVIRSHETTTVTPDDGGTRARDIVPAAPSGTEPLPTPAADDGPAAPRSAARHVDTIGAGGTATTRLSTTA